MLFTCFSLFFPALLHGSFYLLQKIDPLLSGLWNLCLLFEQFSIGELIHSLFDGQFVSRLFGLIDLLDLFDDGVDLDIGVILEHILKFLVRSALHLKQKRIVLHLLVYHLYGVPVVFELILTHHLSLVSS